ncbi:hypothetical protein [Gracilimonas sp.]|uniref:hypothetical protein n=1 Tax=Gracilimonas sp. TaxID=1974203 RepID=UPI0032EAC6AB
MKSLFNKIPKKILPLVVLAAMLSACTLDDISDDINNQELTAEEIEAASQIMGQALSDDNDGVFSSLNDALTNVSSSGFGSDNQMKGYQDHDDDDHSGRGRESNYQYEYDPETGTHTISFDREVNNPNFQKSLSAVLTYVFTDLNGEYIAAPRMNRERIENIDFTSDKTGTTQNRFKSSEFSRADTFSITGVSSASSILTIDGNHYGNGSIDGVTREGDTFERSFVNEINFLDIQVNKDTVAAYGSLTQGVTGTLTYELNLFRSSNGEGSSKTISGTIEMDGDGTALLRFANINRLFKVNLRTGFVSDNEIDIESSVVAVDTLNQTVTLRNDILVQVSDRTEIEGDDGLDSLEAVARALEAGIGVTAEVEGYRNPNNRSEFIAEEIEFELSEDDGDGDDDDDDNDGGDDDSDDDDDDDND